MFANCAVVFVYLLYCCFKGNNKKEFFIHICLCSSLSTSISINKSCIMNIQQAAEANVINLN